MTFCEKKELQVERLRTEIAALHCVIPLLVEASDCAEYGLALPPTFQEIGTGSGKPLSVVEQLSPYEAKLILGYPHASDHLGNRTVIRLRQIKQELSRIKPKRMLKRTA